MTSALTIVKGAYTVTIDAVSVIDNYDKKIIFIRPPQSKQKQDAGPKTVKVIDLLMLTHTIVIRGHLVPTATKTAKEVKDDLIAIIKGAGVTGTACTVTYAGDSFNMFIEKSTIIEKSIDYTPSATETDLIQYDVQLTFSEGVSV